MNSNQFNNNQPGYNSAMNTNISKSQFDPTNPGYDNANNYSGGNYSGGQTDTTDTSFNQNYNDAPGSYGVDNFNGNPSTAQGVKNTVAGAIQKLAGAISGNEERKISGEMRMQEGQQEIKVARTQYTDYGMNINTGNESNTTDTQASYITALNNPMVTQDYQNQNAATGAGY